MSRSDRKTCSNMCSSMSPLGHPVKSWGRPVRATPFRTSTPHVISDNTYGSSASHRGTAPQKGRIADDR